MLLARKEKIANKQFSSFDEIRFFDVQAHQIKSFIDVQMNVVGGFVVTLLLFVSILMHLN